ncbi:hypothetical protein MBLNU13_g05443t2 [Cladosporium sp. NU13]
MPSTHLDKRMPEDTTSSVPSCVPNDPFCQTLYHRVQESLDPAILNHSLRVYIYASALSHIDLTSISQTRPTAGSEIYLPQTSDSKIDSSLLFAASMFHDMGTCAIHDHDQRFEVCGADAAVDYMQTQGMSDLLSQRQVWEAIALHTSPGIAERMGPLTRIVRMAVKADFGNELYRSLLDEGLLETTEALLRRGEIENVLGDCVAGQAERREGEERKAKAPALMQYFEQPILSTHSCFEGIYDPEKSDSKSDSADSVFDNSGYQGGYITGDLSIGDYKLPKLHGDSKVVQNSTVLDSMVANGLVKRRAYSLWLNIVKSDKGNIVFGGVDTEKLEGDLKWIPMTSQVPAYVALVGMS